MTRLAGKRRISGRNSMKQLQIISVLIAMLLLGCSNQRLTQANVDQITEGMSKKQVESILGPPTNVDTKDFLLLKRTTYAYHQANGSVTVLFKDDKVVAKSSTLQKKPGRLVNSTGTKITPEIDGAQNG